MCTPKLYVCLTVCQSKQTETNIQKLYVICLMMLDFVCLSPPWSLTPDCPRPARHFCLLHSATPYHPSERDDTAPSCHYLFTSLHQQAASGHHPASHPRVRHRRCLLQRTTLRGPMTRLPQVRQHCQPPHTRCPDLRYPLAAGCTDSVHRSRSVRYQHREFEPVQLMYAIRLLTHLHVCC